MRQAIPGDRKIRWSISNTIGAGFTIAIVLMVAMGYLSNRSIIAFEEATRWREHTYKVINELESVNSLIRDIETGQRGYVITNDSVFLEPYYVGIASIGSRLERLRELMARSVFSTATDT